MSVMKAQTKTVRNTMCQPTMEIDMFTHTNAMTNTCIKRVHNITGTNWHPLRKVSSPIQKKNLPRLLVSLIDFQGTLVNLNLSPSVDVEIQTLSMVWNFRFQPMKLHCLVAVRQTCLGPKLQVHFCIGIGHSTIRKKRSNCVPRRYIYSTYSIYRSLKQSQATKNQTNMNHDDWTIAS